ncbi:MAG TPA: acetyltransferase [Syntrophorhabdaceae bacterium]|nr:acetyltransferase [Syntrophorhabdaceae bacterium]
MKDIIIIGAGGHSKVVIATALECGFNINSILDDDPLKWGKYIMGFKINGPILSYSDSTNNAVMAIGDNKTRKDLVKKLDKFNWVTLIHPHAYIHPSSKIGKGTVVFAGSIIQPDVNLGEHCIVNTGATIDHDCTIENFVHIAPGVNIAGGAYIGEGAFLGIGSKVIGLKTIGKWSIVGAGGIVTEDIPSRVAVKGVPARIYKRM